MVSNDFMTVFEVNCFVVLIDQLIYKDIRNWGELTRILVSANEAHHILFHVGQLLYSVFIPRHLKKCRVLCYTLQKKFAFECPSVRLSVRPSVRLSVCLSVRQRFVSGLYLEHLLTDFLQTLYRSSYQEGVVWD